MTTLGDLRDLDSLPALLSVPQTAEVIGRSVSSTYRACNTFFRTGGAKGIPCIRLAGDRIVVQTARLLRDVLGLDYDFTVPLTDEDDDQDDLTSDGWPA